jgi:hypothetical protein
MTEVCQICGAKDSDQSSVFGIEGRFSSCFSISMNPTHSWMKMNNISLLLADDPFAIKRWAQKK